MAEQTPPGPKASGRVAGAVAIAAILVGGYYGLVVKPASDKATAPDATSAASGSAPATDAKAGANQAAEGAAPAKEEAAKADVGKAEPEQAIPAQGSAPSFDIVRVEPTGETVVAGLAEPRSKVELLDGSSTIATAEANERGEWAMAVEKPLAAGTHDLSIRTTSADKKTETLSEQSVAVQVQEPGKGEALVVLNTPDAASKVLQKPEVPGEQKVAAAPPEPSAPQAADTTTKQPDAPAKPAEPDAAAQESGTADAAAGAPKSDMPAQTDTLAEADKAAQPAATADDKPADATGTKTADATAPGGEPKVTVDAVEVEDGKLFVAGSAKSRAPVRVYLDEKLVGETKPEENGRWLLETKRSVEPGRRVVRADQVEPDSGKVIVRAEVPFERTEDVAMLAPVVATGGGASGANADGNVPAPQNVIIRRGDNLWTISRRLYGRGIRYSTIYAANNDQIRNPHLIYPGQTFVLPAGDTNWTN
jgi:nucleoid-associated protein YgaU